MMKILVSDKLSDAGLEILRGSEGLEVENQMRHVDEIVSKEEKISEDEFINSIVEVNNYGWKKSEELIK